MKNIMLLLIILIITSCSDNAPINITPKMEDSKVQLGYGVWTNVPSNFNTARTYKGYQGPKYTSSIAIELESE